MTQSHILEHSSKAREVRRFAAMVSLFVGMFMCLGAPAARAPGATTQTISHAVNTGAAVKPGKELGASDLFTALTEPDRNGEIDALRAIRRELTSPDDPRARDAARDHLDALLLETLDQCLCSGQFHRVLPCRLSRAAVFGWWGSVGAVFGSWCCGFVPGHENDLPPGEVEKRTRRAGVVCATKRVPGC